MNTPYTHIKSPYITTDYIKIYLSYLLCKIYNISIKYIQYIYTHASARAHTRTHRISQTIRQTMIFLLDILEKNDDECILILVNYWKKTGLLHTKISNHNIIYSS